jgi:hypothetical protein
VGPADVVAGRTSGSCEVDPLVPAESGLRPSCQFSLSSSLRALVLLIVAWAVQAPFASAQVFWGLTENHSLVRFSREDPAVPLATLPITGLPADERLVGIEVMMPDGLLVGVSGSGFIYELDRRTGAATRRFSNVVPNAQGVMVGMTDTALDLELLSNLPGTGPNRLFTVLNKSDGGDTSLAPPPGSGDIIALAWNRFGVERHVAIVDSTLHRFERSPAAALTPIGPLGVVTTSAAGLDFDPRTGVLYATLTVGGSPGLYRVDASTGQATLLDAISAPVESLTVDAQGAPIITPALSELLELDREIPFTIRRTGDPLVAANYRVRTVSPEGPAAATADQDYVEISTIMSFVAGETEKTFLVRTLPDQLHEANETFEVWAGEDAPNPFTSVARAVIVDNDNQPPVLSLTSPTTNPVTVSTAAVTLSGTAIDDEAGATVKLFLGDASVPFMTTTGPNWTFANVPLQVGTNSMLVVVEDTRALTDAQQLTVVRTDLVTQTFAFAEGVTGPFFSTDLLFMNPNFADVPVSIEFLRDDGVVIPHALTLPPAARVTLSMDAIPGLELATASTIVTNTSFPIVVERTTRWGEGDYGAATEKGAAALSNTWYFAEGSQGFFRTYLLLVNPSVGPNDVTVRFLRQNASPVTRSYTIEPRRRLTLDAGAIDELVDQSFGIEVTFAQPGMAERAMYFGNNPVLSGGHAAAGAPGLSNTWSFAEGATGPFFDTFLLLANPSASPVTVNLLFQPEGGVALFREKTIEPNSRLTVNPEVEDPSLASVAVATQVTASAPIVAERAQYWPFSADRWYEAHASVGQAEAASHWGLAEGRVGGPQNHQTYILIADTGTSPGGSFVTVRFVREHGPVVTKQFRLARFGRLTIDVGSAQVPEITEGAFGAEIISSAPVQVERSMYFDSGGEVWAAGTNATATRLP